MRRQMPRQLASRRKRQIAVLAREWKVRFVRNLVPFETLLVGETFRTLLALEGPFLLMVLQVLRQFLLRQERPLAVHAQELWLVFVYLLMPSQKR